MSQELIFSVTANDCLWSYTKGTGAGGQKRNKTSSAVHCTHVASGAHGYSEASRSQLDNKRDAFRKMAESKAFVGWHKKEVMQRTGQMALVDEAVKSAMRPIHLLVEGKDEDGKWVPLTKEPIDY